MAGMADADVEALKQELAKWQERVPKLAGALRERTSEVEALRTQLAERGTGREEQGPERRSGIEARDSLIEELEAKVRALSGKYQDAEGQLHARDLEITQLRQEASEWREKWQSATTTLDAQADNAGQKDRELSRIKQEVDELLTLQESHQSRIKEQDLELTELRERAQSLEGRNANLFETTELANRQIETLGDNLEHLRSELAASKSALSRYEDAAGDALKEIEELKGQVASRDQDIEFLHKHIEEKQTEISRLSDRVTELEPLEAASAQMLEERKRQEDQIASLNAEIDGLTERLVELDAARKSLETADEQIRDAQALLAASQNEIAARDEQLAAREADIEAQKEEVRHLEACVVNAEEATIRFEVERRQLSEQLDELKRRNQHLESQLSDRSDLVVGLEQEKSAISTRTSSLEAENKRLSEALEKAQQAARGNADHIAHVDARLERQKELMENLEAEFAEVQEEFANAVKSHQREIGEKNSELAVLREKVDDDSVSKLRQEIAALERALDELRAEREAADAAASEARAENDKAANAARDLEARFAEEAAARKTQSEKIVELEQQLQKQSRATAAAEEAAADARASLEAANAELSRVPDEVSSENANLQAEVIKLEGMVRERTEQLNKLRWQQDMIEKQGAVAGSESKMLVVLNQQLQSAREDNERLKSRIRELETLKAEVPAPASVPGAEKEGPDDLASIKGIGPKLVKQLSKRGITRFDQIATLSQSDLDDVSHPLHSMKGRILKDNWIEQAARLGGII
jgi:predicted flap endonuclease-1-like 5' DNA nuclease